VTDATSALKNPELLPGKSYRKQVNMLYESGYEKCAHFYDLFADERSIEFFCRYGDKAGEILDIGTGTGRIALPMARNGVKVACVEPSPAMRKIFEQKLIGNPVLNKYITLVEGTAQSFNLDKSFPVACLSGVFDHFIDYKERLSSLLNIGKHLMPNGRLIFDVFQFRINESPPTAAGEAKRGKRLYCRRVGYERLSENLFEITLIFEIFEGGRLLEEIVEHSKLGVIDRHGIHRLMNKAGYDLDCEYGGYDSAPYKEGDSVLIIEAVRKE
jgi:SAM-dependent methyltransferase